MQLTHVRLLVADFDACFRFYRDVMGFPVLWGREGGGYADFQAGEGACLALFDRREMAKAVGTDALPGNAECQDRAMLILQVEDLEATVAQLRARGVQSMSDIQAHPEWGIRTAYVRDPDGTLIELNVPLLPSEWTQDLREADERYSSGQSSTLKEN